jgi:hypothetical protein
MITQLKVVPDNMVAFEASGQVTKEDFETVVMPAVTELVTRTNELNYLMLISTDLSNFTIGAWLQDLLLGIKEITKWNRAAIVTEEAGINTFTNIFSVIVPGEFKGYGKDELAVAINWVANGDDEDGLA